MPVPYDLAITGAGPAGAACALAAARLGLRVALLERSPFPRHKVCGDCLNPSVWPVLEALGCAPAIRALDHASLHRVRFASPSGRPLEVALPPGAERAVTRESFDLALLDAAQAAGATLFSGHPLTHLEQRPPLWHLATASHTIAARALVAADGRNSTTCHLLGLFPRSRPHRVALQCHAPLAEAYRGTVALEWLPHGYCGIAPVDSQRMNICLVATTAHLAAAKAAAHLRFALPPDHPWRSIAPLERADLPPAPFPGCFLVGDAARVVEPFTGEGIYYALHSGQLAAAAAAQFLRGDPGAAANYRRTHRRLYRHRLWPNRLARLAVTHPQLGNLLLRVGRQFPSLMSYLTAKVLRTVPTAP